MFQEGFPINLKDDVSFVANFIDKYKLNIDNGMTKETISYTQDSTVIEFPYRIYFNDLPLITIDNITLQQKMILHCIYTRSCDGYVRQKHLQSLLLMDYADWVIPYIVKVCDEYIVEILEMTYAMLKERDTERIKRFCLDNVDIFCKSYARMISYWDVYYRNMYKHFHGYIGRKLFKECFGYSRTLERLRDYTKVSTPI